MKKFIILSLVFFLFFAVSCDMSGKADGGGAGNQQKEYSSVIPSYERYKGERTVDLMAFWAPPADYESYRIMKDCGFTSVLIDNKYDAYSTDVRDRILNYCDALELNAYFPVSRDSTENIANVYGSLIGHDSFKGFYLDEPILKTHMHTMLQHVIEAENLREDLVFICNILGGYPDNDPAAFRWMFSSDEEFEANKHLIYDDYDEYLDDLCDNVIDEHANVRLSVSGAYPLLKDETEYGTSLSGGWLNGMGMNSELVKRKGLKRLNYFIQSTAFHNGGNVNYRRSVSEDDIRWQINICLTYGVTDISYFTYTSLTAPGPETDEGDTALIYWTDENDTSTYYPTDAYYAAKNVNEELSGFEYVYRSFEWQNVMFNKVTDCIETESNFDTAAGVASSNKRIKSIKSGDDLVTGCFVDENGYDGFMFTNFDNTYLSQNNNDINEITVNFAHCKKAVVYYRGERQVISTPNGVFNYGLKVGDSVFVIPVA